MSFLKNVLGKKETPIESYIDFWKWFESNEASFSKVVRGQGDIETKFFNKLSSKLGELKEGLYYSTGMYDDSTVELIITAEGIVKNIIFVEELINSAPNINGWKFTALKQGINITDVTIKMSGYEFNTNNISFYSNVFPEYPDEVDITIVHSDFNENNKETIVNGTFIFLDNYLGELNFVTTIDNVVVVGRKEANQELVNIQKLKDFLIWRQKEFIEKYEGLRYDTEKDNYTAFEAELEDGKPLLAVINTDLLNWDRKASHPWIMKIEIKYEGKSNDGLPETDTYELLDEIENKSMSELRDSDGYLINIGRQTADNTREVYFACNDFRKPSKILHLLQNMYKNKLEIKYDIYKDKYWQTLDRFK